jgi:hypothetical protein
MFKRQQLRGVDHGLVHQEVGNVVPDRIHPPTLPTFQTLAAVFENERFLANRAHQNVEQVLGNHAGNSTPGLWALGSRLWENLKPKA